MRTSLRPTPRGTDLTSIDLAHDAHVRIETVAGSRLLMVDIFRSTVEDADEAHVASETFPPSPRGHRDASSFLREFRFEVALK